jgi:hypothetical protein
MSSDMRFEGKLVYANRAAADEAVARARELLSEEDEDLRQIFAEDPSFMRMVDETITVSIALSGPSDWWFSFEGLVETLAETAETGFVDGVLEGAEGKTRYHAGGEEEELD